MATGVVGQKYQISRRIGGGSFGEIFLGVGPNNEKVAVKFERHGAKCPQLRHEYKVYRELANAYGFCSVHYFGTQENFNVMVMDLLGPSLEDLFTKCNRRLSLKTVLQIADQLLDRVDTLHSRHLIHRDIKPANFCIGVGTQSAYIYCVDFGLSKRFRNPKTLQHIPYRDGRSLTGTPRYASINNHLGIEQSRRDDLESIGYILVYFLKGSLPWQGLKAKNAQRKYGMILEKKQQVSVQSLCHGIPPQFADYLNYCRSLKFDSKPDVPYLRGMFRDLYVSQGCGSGGRRWDWDVFDTDELTAGLGLEDGVGLPGQGIGGVGGIEGGQDPPFGPPRHTSSTVPLGQNLAGHAALAHVTAQHAHILSQTHGNDVNTPIVLDDEDDAGSRQAVGDGEEDEDRDAKHRPQSTGDAMRASRSSGGLLTSQGAPYDYGSNNVNMLPTYLAQKRPHTTQGTALNGSAGMQAVSGSGTIVIDKKLTGYETMDVAMEDDHVESGARVMARVRRTRTDEAGLLTAQRSAGISIGAGVSGLGIVGSTSAAIAASASINKSANGSSAVQYHPRDIRQTARLQQPVSLQRPNESSATYGLSTENPGYVNLNGRAVGYSSAIRAGSIARVGTAPATTHTSTQVTAPSERLPINSNAPNYQGLTTYANIKARAAASTTAPGTIGSGVSAAAINVNSGGICSSASNGAAVSAKPLSVSSGVRATTTGAATGKSVYTMPSR